MSIRSKKVYAIFDKKADNYISMGYNPKSTWGVFPGAAIKHSDLDINSEDYEVHTFEMVRTTTLNLKGKEI